jgi:hypothetical protein
VPEKSIEVWGDIPILKAMTRRAHVKAQVLRWNWLEFEEMKMTLRGLILFASPQAFV